MNARVKRATRTSHAIDRGATLPEVQATLGHGNIATLARAAGVLEWAARPFSLRPVARNSPGRATVSADAFI
jgi:hypothetical protein